MPDTVTIMCLGEPVPWAQNSNPNAIGGQVRYRPIPRKQRNAFAALRYAAQQAMDGREELFDGPLMLTMRAERSIPKSWSKKNKNAAILGRLWPDTRPDLGKILRLVEDALKGVVYTDDARVCKQVNEKVYSNQPKLVITITALDTPP